MIHGSDWCGKDVADGHGKVRGVVYKGRGFAEEPIDEWMQRTSYCKAYLNH